MSKLISCWICYTLTLICADKVLNIVLIFSVLNFPRSFETKFCISIQLQPGSFPALLSLVHPLKHHQNHHHFWKMLVDHYYCCFFFGIFFDCDFRKCLNQAQFECFVVQVLPHLLRRSLADKFCSRILPLGKSIFCQASHFQNDSKIFGCICCMKYSRVYRPIFHLDFHLLPN